MASEATDAASPSPTPALSPAASPGSEPPSMALSPSAGGSERLLFGHDLVSGRHRGSVRFGLVVMIYGEDDFDSDSEIDVDITGDGGGKGGGGGGGIGGVPGNSDTENGAADSRTRPLGRGFVRVQWYPDGVKQDVHETKVISANCNATLSSCSCYFIVGRASRPGNIMLTLRLVVC